MFHLRKGIKFSNGKTVTPKDVVASFQRIYKVKGPNAGSFYAGIVGATACNKTPATCTLKGGVVANDAANTITINLVKPDSEFKYKLAVPFASIVPADSPPKDVGTKPLPGTGAYYFASYDPNKQLVMKRNPYFKQWSQAAQPAGYPDEIIQSYGLTGSRRSPRSRMDRRTGRTRTHRPTASARWARSTRARCTSPR